MNRQNISVNKSQYWYIRNDLLMRPIPLSPTATRRYPTSRESPNNEPLCDRWYDYKSWRVRTCWLCDIVTMKLQKMVRSWRTRFCNVRNFVYCYDCEVLYTECSSICFQIQDKYVSLEYSQLGRVHDRFSERYIYCLLLYFNTYRKHIIW